MIDVHKLMNPAYLFDIRPAINSELLYLLSGAFALAIIASGILWFILTKREKTLPPLRNVRGRLVSWAFSTGLVGLFLVFFRATGIPYFSMRFVLILWLAISGVWLLSSLVYLLKKFPKERSLYEEQRLRERYLPKKRETAR